jgi:hypothetical protein
LKPPTPSKALCYAEVDRVIAALLQKPVNHPRRVLDEFQGGIQRSISMISFVPDELMAAF